LFDVVSLLTRRIGWEYSIVNRAGLPNQTGSLEFRLWDKSNNFTHCSLQTQAGNCLSFQITIIMPSRLGGSGPVCTPDSGYAGIKCL
jgi:hypothetical protein